MLTSPRKLPLLLSAFVLAATVSTTACHHHGDDADYKQWEAETHRAHVELEKRAAEEQRAFREWRDHHVRH